LADAQRRILADPANFCPSPQCAVAYFDGFESFVLETQLLRPVHPKDPNAPLCACTGLTRHEVEQDVDEGGVTRTKSALERAKSPDARCAELAANGRPCVAYVQKYFMQCRNRRDAGR
jgi:hypothetical protein